jgi:hypothetical protein
VSPGVEIVQRIEDQLEATEPLEVELRILDICKVGYDLDIGIEDLRGFFCYL